jgi:acetate kinase
MGFTPLEGLMMNTRCGDLDPGTVFYLMSKENLSIQETEEILNYKSGILGILKFSSDLRDAIEMINKDQKAKMAFDMYSQRVKKYVFFYSLLLQKPDIIVFTDSLGVLVPLLREKICSSLKFMDIEIDKVKNNNYNKGTVEISTPSSQTKIFILPTDEEVMIAREAYKEYTHGNNN